MTVRIDTVLHGLPSLSYGISAMLGEHHRRHTTCYIENLTILLTLRAMHTYLRDAAC